MTCIVNHTDVTLALNRRLYGNNSIVSLSDIGRDLHSALLCLTNNSDCCDSEESQHGTGGAWYEPNRRLADDQSFGQNRGSSVVHLFRKDIAGTVSGIFQCLIPDANGTEQKVFVGVYPSDSGMN